MALFKARALYDFNGEPNTAEISITSGEVLSVTRTDIGEGWWEGLNSKGQSGLFPEAYVEKIVDNSRPPSMPPPVLPPQDWAEASPAGCQDDDWDDEWDNDDTYSEIANNVQRETHYSNEPNINQMGTHGGQQFDNMSEANFGVDNKGTVTKKTFNRFSTFVKSGLESYMLGTVRDTPGSRVRIYRETDNIYRWEMLSNPYTVQVTSPKKATKMGGLKSFIAYQLTPSYTGIEVSRRYKHFDWLHDRLSDKFNIIAIPPLPDKQISGRYEEHFIEHRRVQLQEFVSYVCRHPVLSTCEVWNHFLTCTNEKQWKEGKRKAEKDNLVGASFCLCIEAPDKDLLASTVDSKIESSIAYINQIDQSMKGLIQTSMDQQKKCDSMYKREYMKIGESFFTLGVAFECGEGMFNELSTDIKKIGTTYMEVAKLFEEQSKIDWQPLSDKLYLYRGITSSFPDIFSMQRHADQKRKECERNNQMTHLQINEVRKRTDVLTYAIFAELDHFQSEMNTEFRTAMKSFLSEQVNFYKNIVRKFEDTLERFQ